MSMAGGGVTAGLVVDGIDHPQRPVSFLAGEGSRAGGDGKFLQGTVDGVAGVTGFPLLVHHEADFRGIRGEHDLTILVEQSNLLDAFQITSERPHLFEDRQDHAR